VTLVADAITVKFGGLTAVDGVSFTVSPGEIFGLIGPNGAGKTTLFNSLTGLVNPSTGTVNFEGKRIDSRQPYQVALAGVARTFQNIRLFRELSALDNVRIARHTQTSTSLWSGVFGLPRARREERDTMDRSMELLDLVGLKTRAHEPAGSFPYADQRRLEIARALAIEPRLLLLDEPAAGMNPNEKEGLVTFIRDVRERYDLTICLIEHHVPLVMGVCDRVGVLNFGRIIAVGPPAEVRDNPAVVEAYLGDDA
jgi:branched-chain amino acid transport system ATP-binding protein